MNPFLHTLIRPHYRTLQGYVSAGMEMEKSDDKIFLNANENPFELPGLEGLNRYPAPQPPALAEAYAQAYGVEAENVVMTRGADEAIVILTKLFCEPEQDSVLICPPTFGMYGVNAKTMPANVVEVPLIRTNGTFDLDYEGILNLTLSHGEREASGSERGEGRIKMVYICSPNNPSGTSFDHEKIFELTEKLAGHAIIILDETYAEFSTQGSMSADLAALPNLIILRTLSKSYAFAGMRMGCFLNGDPEFIALVKAKCLDAYPLPIASIEAAFHVLSPEISAIAAENRTKLLAERDRVIAAFKTSPHVVHIYPTDANFFLVEMKDAARFHKFAQDNNVILRDFSTKPGTENCLRISIGLPSENDVLIRLLGKFES
jgi:histidinol-phosphate aminotransferase